MTDSISRRLAVVQRAIGRALLKSERRVQEAQAALDATREGATVDGKGRRVYRTADRQRGFTDDGQELSREEVKSINWDPKAPTWEQRQAIAWQARSGSMRKFCGRRKRADYYSERMRSGDMLTRDELETIRKDLDAMPWAVKAEMKAVRCAAAGRMARATSFGLSEEFTLSANELADSGATPQMHRARARNSRRSYKSRLNSSQRTHTLRQVGKSLKPTCNAFHTHLRRRR